MKLTTLQKRTLLFFNSFNSAPPTVRRQLSFNWIAWALLLILGAISCVALLVPGLEAAGYLLIGMILGAFFRDIGRYRAIVRVWPVYREIINWQRVSELLDPSEKHDVRCVQCGANFNIEEMISVGEHHVCARCKPVFLQKLAEGSPIDPHNRKS